MRENSSEVFCFFAGGPTFLPSSDGVEDPLIFPSSSHCFLLDEHLVCEIPLSCIQKSQSQGNQIINNLCLPKKNDTKSKINNFFEHTRDKTTSCHKTEQNRKQVDPISTQSLEHNRCRFKHCSQPLFIVLFISHDTRCASAMVKI